MNQAQMDTLLEYFPGLRPVFEVGFVVSLFIVLWMIKRHFADPKPDESGRPAGRLGPTDPDFLGHGGDAGGSSCDVGSDSCCGGD